MTSLNLNSIQSPTAIALEVLLDDGSFLSVHEIVRVVPHKRLVCKGVWNKKHVYAKLFIGAHARRYAERDKNGVQALVNANIATPDLLYEGKIEASEILIFKAIESSQNAENRYQRLMQSNDAQQKAARFNLAIKLTEAVAQLHKANLLQTDLYFKNFLIDAETIYTIDGDGIRPISPFFKQRQKHQNLATLFSKLDALDSNWINDCYAHYCEKTGTKYAAIDAANIDNLTRKIRQKIASAFADKKVFRTCTDVKVTQSFGRYIAATTDFSVAGISENELDDALLNPQNRLKSGNTCTVGKALFANQNIVIKRYNIKNIWHGFKLSISQSRAAKSWANAHRLNLLNVATAKPLALIEKRFGCLKRKTYFLAEYIDAPDIADFFALSTDIETKQKVAYETALLFYKLNLLQISHGDCKASNIKIVDGKPVLIDLDSMQAHTNVWWFEKKHIKDLKRFMQNWANTPEISAIFKRAFVQVYDEIDDYTLPTILERAQIA